MTLKAWLYRNRRPNWLASILNRFWATLHGVGIAPDYLVTLEVRGRRSGRSIKLPLVMIVVDGERYLVSMLGTDVDWVRNVNASAGSAILRHGRTEEVYLEPVAIDRRAPCAHPVRAVTYLSIRMHRCRSSRR
jgi:hypothetical protein